MTHIDYTGWAIFGLLGIIGSALFYSEKKAARIEKQRQEADQASQFIKELAANQKVEVPADVLESVAKEAVKTQLGPAIDAVIREHTKRYDDEIGRCVKVQVDSVKESIFSKVSGEIQRQVDDLNIETLKQRVSKAAKDKAVEKLSVKMDDILSEFDSSVGDLGRIYKSMLLKQSKNRGGLDNIDMMRLLL